MGYGRALSKADKGTKACQMYPPYLPFQHFRRTPTNRTAVSSRCLSMSIGGARSFVPVLAVSGQSFLPALSCSDLENDFPTYPESLGQLEVLEAFSHSWQGLLLDLRLKTQWRCEEIDDTVDDAADANQRQPFDVSLITADRNEHHHGPHF